MECGDTWTYICFASLLIQLGGYDLKKVVKMFLSLVFICILCISCRTDKTSDKAIYLGTLEDVDYMYIIPSENGEEWDGKIEISTDNLVEMKGIMIPFSGFQESESGIYNIRFHSDHYYYIDFYDIKLNKDDYLFFWPADDEHPLPVLDITRTSESVGGQKKVDKYEARDVVYEF